MAKHEDMMLWIQMADGWSTDEPARGSFSIGINGAVMS